MGEFSQQSISNLLWALAVLQATRMPIFNVLIEHLHTQGETMFIINIDTNAIYCSLMVIVIPALVTLTDLSIITEMNLQNVTLPGSCTVCDNHSPLLAVGVDHLLPEQLHQAFQAILMDECERRRESPLPWGAEHARMRQDIMRVARGQWVAGTRACITLVSAVYGACEGDVIGVVVGGNAPCIT